MTPHEDKYDGSDSDHDDDDDDGDHDDGDHDDCKCGATSGLRANLFNRINPDCFESSPELLDIIWIYMPENRMPQNLIVCHPFPYQNGHNI